LDFELAYRRLNDPAQLWSAEIAREVADELGDSLLGFERVSDGHVDFVCRVLSERALSGRPGLENLIIALYLDREKLTEVQLQCLFDCLAGAFGLVTEENLAFAMGDFVARVASPRNALQLLRDMTTNAMSTNALAGVFLGLDILRRHRQDTNAVLLEAVEAAAKIAEGRIEVLEAGVNSA
jgi:hypothetical protein